MDTVECVNKNFSTLHLMNKKTLITCCGLKWHKKTDRRRQEIRDREVWIPDSVFFNPGKKCKKCFQGIDE